MRYKDYSVEKLVQILLDKGKEGEFWDFKQEWHQNMPDLIKDIICFANTVHDENCYLIFGISDKLEITGMALPRRKQADIIEALSNLKFAGDVVPQICVDTVLIKNVELDVLTILTHNLRLFT